jgi:hypothetical protein
MAWLHDGLILRRVQGQPPALRPFQEPGVEIIGIDAGRQAGSGQVGQLVNEFH